MVRDTIPVPAEESWHLEIQVPQPLRRHAEMAIVRLGYLYPRHEFSVEDGVLHVRGHGDADPATIRREVLHAVYREKIYDETLPLRQTLLEMVARR